MTATENETAWRSGRFDARRGPSQLLFGRMYEDASIEQEAFRSRRRVFCIASAGCTAITLAPRHEVVAVDINPVQLAYAERRFAGFRATPGAAERLMGFARALAPAVGWWPSLLRAFLDLDDPGEQSAFWRRHLDGRRFRAGFDGMLTLAALRAVYSSPLLAFLPRHFGRVLRGRLERAFALHSNRANPYARALFLGESSDEPAPPEARGIRLVHADAAACLEREPAGSFDGFALSNVLDGASAAYEERLLAAVKRAAAPEAVAVVRSFREPRGACATNRAVLDRAMIWGVVDVRPAALL